ncbi:hypothetical protein CO172_03025 [Candidatus Uhrbacteria bacterium CG_4_9_14_3_um_filter_36_7]|uniref:Dipeptidylpeptidase IV N-terminal domain-containing protein n=1 Tax=Candidatus Uhrbacteria bacterium CG_4_9_14_3_um_filter_36_7 TaxID=1975033 RepID=A0A2M7XH13_9BACT|nr:MAG: hypothetical protein CO172_03025 [Candidatus Uhrbacteria bacterium CG_4_9_14_3_um_filter_36_7]
MPRPNSQRFQKIILIFLFALSVIGIAFALYFMFFRVPPSQEKVVESDSPQSQTDLPISKEGVPPSVTETKPSTLPQADAIAKGSVTQTENLLLAPVEAAELRQDKMHYYDERDGKFYTIDKNGVIKELSKREFTDAQNIIWNKDGDKVVVEFPDGSNIVYDFTSGKQVTLPKHWEDFHFSPTSNELIAKSMPLDPNGRALVVSNADGSNVRAVQALGENADKVLINPSPQGQVIAFSDTANESYGLGRSMLIPLGKNQENFKGLVIEGFGFEPLWSTRGDYLIYSVSGESSQNLPLLWIVNGSVKNMGDGRQNLGLNTWAHKCTFTDISELYCAVPSSLPPYAGMQPDIAKGIPDVVYKIDLTTRQSILIGTTDTKASMTNLHISSDKQILYFTNENTGLIQSMRLK